MTLGEGGEAAAAGSLRFEVTSRGREGLTGKYEESKILRVQEAVTNVVSDHAMYITRPADVI